MNSSPKKLGSKSKDERSRIEIFEKDGTAIELPVCGASYILSFLGELGWAGAGGMGTVTLSAVEIQAWCKLADVDLTPWEFKAIKSASRAYVSQSYNEDQTAPYKVEVVKPSFVGKFKGMAKQLNKGQ